MKFRSAPGALALLFAVASVHSARAAAPPGEPPRFSEIMEVQLVALEVVVEDAGGRPITDLAPSEFSVFEDGAQVPLEHVELVRASVRTGSSPVGSTATGGDERPPVHLAIFVDEVHVGAASRILLLRQMAEALRTGLGPLDEVMIAAYDGATRVVLPFTTDRKALAEALDALETVSATRLAADSTWRSTMEYLVDDANGRFGWSRCLHSEEYVETYMRGEWDQASRAVDALGSFVDSLAGIVGRKAVLHVSDGIPARPGAEAAGYAQELCSGAAPKEDRGPTEFAATSPDAYDAQHRTMDSSANDMSSKWEEVAARANAGNVSIYTFQAGPTPDLASPAELPQARPSTTLNATNKANRQEPLFVLADRSGGRAFFDGRDLGGALDSTLGELQSYYLLTYTPRAPATSAIRKVRLDLARPGAVARYRKVYRPRTPHEQVADQLVGRLLYAPGGEPSPLTLALVARQPAANGKAKARFRLELPLDSLTLTEEKGLRQGLLTVFVAVADDSGLASAVRESRVPVRVAPAGPTTPQRFVWEVEIQLRTGAPKVALAVRDEVSGDTSFIVRRFDLGKQR
jgi:VWFA-related protein